MTIRAINHCTWVCDLLCASTLLLLATLSLQERRLDCGAERCVTEATTAAMCHSSGQTCAGGTLRLRAVRPAVPAGLQRAASIRRATAARTRVRAAPGEHASAAGAAAANASAQPPSKPSSGASSAPAPVAPTAETIGDDTPSTGDAVALAAESEEEAVTSPAEVLATPQPPEAPADSNIAKSPAQEIDTPAPTAGGAQPPRKSAGDRA